MLDVFVPLGMSINSLGGNDLKTREWESNLSNGQHLEERVHRRFISDIKSFLQINYCS